MWRPFLRSSRGRFRALHRTAPRLGRPTTFINVLDPDLRTPEAYVGNVEWNQRLGRRLLFKLEFMRREGSHEFIVTPDATTRELRARQHRHLSVQGARGHDAVPGRRATGHHCFIRLGQGDSRSQQLRSVLRQPAEPDHPLERKQSDSDRCPASAADSRHSGASWHVGLRAAAGAPIGISMVGCGRVPRFRGCPQPHRAPPRGSHARFHARATDGGSRGTASVQA